MSFTFWFYDRHIGRLFGDGIGSEKDELWQWLGFSEWKGLSDYVVRDLRVRLLLVNKLNKCWVFVGPTMKYVSGSTHRIVMLCNNYLYLGPTCIPKKQENSLKFHTKNKYKLCWIHKNKIVTMTNRKILMSTEHSVLIMEVFKAIKCMDRQIQSADICCARCRTISCIICITEYIEDISSV